MIRLLAPIAFNLVKGCNSKDYVDGSAFMALERFKNKFEHVSAPSLFKMENSFVSALSKRIKTLKFG
jgi:hypothetical protein